MADGPPDPRPRVLAREEGHVVAGARCASCWYPVAFPRPCCPVCGGPVADAAFGPGGTVWSATVVRVPVPGREPPYGLAYVDLDDGPRILAHAPGDAPLGIGSRVRLGPPGPAGDLTVEAAG